MTADHIRAAVFAAADQQQITDYQLRQLTGLGRGLIAEYRAGTRRPSVEAVLALAGAVGLSVRVDGQAPEKNRGK